MPAVSSRAASMESAARPPLLRAEPLPVSLSTAPRPPAAEPSSSGRALGRLAPLAPSAERALSSGGNTPLRAPDCRLKAHRVPLLPPTKAKLPQALMARALTGSLLSGMASWRGSRRLCSQAQQLTAELPAWAVMRSAHWPLLLSLCARAMQGGSLRAATVQPSTEALEARGPWLSSQFCLSAPEWKRRRALSPPALAISQAAAASALPPPEPASLLAPPPLPAK